MKPEQLPILTHRADFIANATLSNQHRVPKLVQPRPIDVPKPLKVIYIGAGISGILASILFRQTVPSLDLVIYEKNPEIGGTWYENR